MSSTRRVFLSRAAASVATWCLAPRWCAASAGATDSILVVLRLGGGNDGLNTVIPCDDDRYHRARPRLAIGKDRALPFTSSLYFHPSLLGLRELADAGRVAIVSNVGYPDPDRSHFKSMDVWHSGSLVESPRRGFLAPLVDRDPGPAGEEAAIAVIDDPLPLALIGERRAAPVIVSLDDFGAIDRSLVVEPDPEHEEPLARLTAAHRAALRLDERLAAISGSRDRGLPGSKLGGALSTVLDLIAAGVRPRVFYVAHDGFDTHVRQAEPHAELLADLGDCLRAFDRALPAVIDPSKVACFAFSEFGRRVEENESLGTDHGAAAPVFLVSRALAPGLYGGAPDLADLEDGDLRFAIDFRSVLATLVRDRLGLDPASCLGPDAGSFPRLPLFSKAV